MTRALRAVPWLYAAAAGVSLASVALADGRAVGPAVAIGAGALAAFVGRTWIRLPWLFALAPLAAGARLTTIHLDDSFATIDDIEVGDGVLNLLVGVVLAVALGTVLRVRRGRFAARDVADVAAVATGSGLVAWLVVANPLMADFDVAPGPALAAASYLPLAALLATFTIDLLATGLLHNRAMQFVVAAASTNLAATLLASLGIVEVVSADSRPLALGLLGAALLLLCAGTTHADIPLTLEIRGSDPVDQQDASVRLVLVGAAFVAPIVIIATVAPTSPTDVAVRTVGAIALVALVVVRLHVAMRDHRRARRALLGRIHSDELTGLPTRLRFAEIVADVLDETWRSAQQPTIIQLNLDRFKNINDSLGHAEANRVLVTVSRRLEQGAADFGGVVARLGGDDFVVLDRSTESTGDALARVDAIRRALQAPIRIDDATIFVTASIGVSVAPRNRTVSAEELMRRADIATYRAKADGRNRTAVFDDSMQAHLEQRMDVEHALHGAIGRREMRLYHQPIVDIGSGQVTGFEALIRWQRTDGPPVPPMEFIPIAEETGMIREIGAWALHQALSELRAWIDAGVVPPGTTTSVNASPRQIVDPDFADVVRDALASTGVPPHLLWLEMTESMMLDEPERARETLLEIRSMGVRLALDDFGTGYSSLSLLQQFPIQRLKIDRAFVQGIADHDHDRSLVRTIIAMAHSMGLDLVAEGVETVQQLQALRELSCDKAQGYLISHPIPADAMRSTMVALRELADLSVFGPLDSSPAGARSLVASEPAALARMIGSPPGSGLRPISPPVR